jgi:uncharacterized protein YcbX
VAENARIGSVTECWRYAVKSMQGELLAALDVGRDGVVGDRGWAVINVETANALSAKTAPKLLEARATISADGVRIVLPDGRDTVAGDPEADAILSTWLDRDVRLEPAGAGTRSSYEMTFDPPNDDAERVEIPSPEGTYLDLAALHVLTMNSLNTCANSYEAGAWDRRRFRPNALVEALGDDGYPEDAWVGRAVTLGGATIDVLMRTVRCAMPLRAQPPRDNPDSDGALPRDVNVFRTLQTIHDNHLGVYASVREPGVIRVGDPVSFS